MRSARWTEIASARILVSAAAAQTIPAGTPLKVRRILDLFSLDQDE